MPSASISASAIPSNTSKITLQRYCFLRTLPNFRLYSIKKTEYFCRTLPAAEAIPFATITGPSYENTSIVKYPSVFCRGIFGPISVHLRYQKFFNLKICLPPACLYYLKGDYGVSYIYGRLAGFFSFINFLFVLFFY